MFRQLQLPDGVSGAVFLHSMPGRYEALDFFYMELGDKKIDQVVCLTPLNEITRCAPAYAAAIADDTFPCPRKVFPISDFQVPDDKDAFCIFVKALAKEIQGGSRLLIHCAGGIGRTGTVAACLLKALGLDTETARKRVEAAGSNAEVAGQRDLVDNFNAG